jgi:hypothetical protein
MVYKAAASVLSHQQLNDIDDILDNVMAAYTQNMHSFPRKLIHIDNKQGKLGIQSFSFQTECRKLQKLFGCLRSQQTHGQAAKGLLSRLARKHGYHASANQQLIISSIPERHSVRKLFLDGPHEMLASYGLYFCRAGVPDSPHELRCLLPVLIPKDDKELHQYCKDTNMLNLSDITILHDGARAWFLEGPLQRLQPLLPHSPPSGPSVLLTGQYWKLTHHLRTYGLQMNDVVRIDGTFRNKVVITRYKRTKLSNRVTHCQHQTQVP